MKLPVEVINKLQSDPDCIRNICILAHVDHGKTSLSDSLLATNGIVSQRMAGKTRFLDSREDEQLRGITMESSAISLYFKSSKRKEGTEEIEIKEHLINLIDSPGHIDFSSEVSTASRLCDGAIVLVDVVEGVCSQTVNVLRQCWVDKLKPILVLNKIDRLIIEWQLTPSEAYQHMSRVIEQVNSVIGTFYSGERMEDDMIWKEKGQVGDFVEKDDTDLYFSPELNNVIFASAVDGWAFSINIFASFMSKKLGFSQAVLSKTLWGDFYLDMKNKKIIPGKKLKSSQSNLKLLFVSLVLEQIWSVYDVCVMNRDEDKLTKIIEKLGARVSPRDLRSKDHKNLLNVIMSQWIPVSHAILGMVIDYLPSPVKAQNEKMSKLLDECIYNVFSDIEDKSQLIDQEFEKSIKTCDRESPEKNTLAYVSKMISIPNAELPKDFVTPALSKEELKERSRIVRQLAKEASEAAAAAQEAARESTTDEFSLPLAVNDPFEWEYEEDYFDDDEVAPEETLIAFTRVFSGSLSRHQKVTVIGPKYDPSLPKDNLTNKTQIFENIVIQDLYLIMGRDLIRMETVPAGNIVGVVGLDNIVLKNATIISTTRTDDSHPYINLASTSTLIHNKPIMKIAIEPTNLLHLGKIERGLDILSKADPVFEWYIDEDSGELIMCVAGELHLERCLKDLKDRFAKGCEVTVKEPVIPFREGLDPSGSSAFKSEDTLTTEVEGLRLEFETYALTSAITKFLLNSESELAAVRDLKVRNTAAEHSFIDQFVDKFKNVIEDDEEEDSLKFIQKLGFNTAQSFIDNIVACGPKKIGPNILVESTFNHNKFRYLLSSGNPVSPLDLEPHVINGFQLATNEGPLAGEPLQGVLVLIKSCEELEKEEDNEDTFLLGSQGRVITHTRDLIHEKFLFSGARLFLAMYTCEIQAATEALGKVYAVVQKRGGAIISEELKEGTPFFTVVARVPVIEAYGFAEEVRMRTSGAATPQLVFDGFDILSIDPYWVPHTEEELEELGEFAERENVGRRYMNNIRRRKGLFVDEKVVKNAEKQRTMKKD
ncbi:Cytoplasmic GTPase/eEF2-like protein (ribosomal biogenesis) [Yamadazyma tenuis]|uniref:Ribosome assembly protein 1 n=1 Tax=Candida tenuis (strain ATCC 10573 / BCRC 21748 / CBS 615 / JCM 9827 / NBRC 10315 / NRRL Y-1498 / VKM Y-70) TaxID=590646 RepID=G3BDZ9_CANTC|nr:uncharacterized protein CANTEDRAFT_127639 [Yamadazyma tenuis ATCC 10573]EGV60419.1 hypothetical protein CANTEDRAFT_127639 [Yamadazyma tenuis ATCC 10573]WEJ94333.1 Cytoplasmic GTPase/eEF2-like protein (ribosomal biogenesis) [Yamadazyma tenuis]